MSPTDTFLAKIERFLKRNNISPTVFGQEAVGDGSFVFDLRAGRSPTLRLVQKVETYIKRCSSRAKLEAAE